MDFWIHEDELRQTIRQHLKERFGDDAKIEAIVFTQGHGGLPVHGMIIKREEGE